MTTTKPGGNRLHHLVHVKGEWKMSPFHALFEEYRELVREISNLESEGDNDAVIEPLLDRKEALRNELYRLFMQCDDFRARTQ